MQQDLTGKARGNKSYPANSPEQGLSALLQSSDIGDMLTGI